MDRADARRRLTHAVGHDPVEREILRRAELPHAEPAGELAPAEPGVVVEEVRLADQQRERETLLAKELDGPRDPARRQAAAPRRRVRLHPTDAAGAHRAAVELGVPQRDAD